MIGQSPRNRTIRLLGSACGLLLGAGVVSAVDATVARADTPPVLSGVPAGAPATLTPPAVPVSAAPGVPSDLGAPATTVAPTTVPPPALPPTTPPPTTVPPTTVPVPSTVAPTTVPVTSPPPVTAPPATTPPPPPPTTRPAPSRQARVEQRYAASVPAAWRAAFAVRFSIIDGDTSWSHPDGRIEIAATHADSSDAHLAVVITHEFGHLIAYRYGSGAYAGAAPQGWPEATSNPAEHWADCVEQVFTGTVDPSHGLPPCAGDQLAWARQYLAAGPPAA